MQLIGIDEVGRGCLAGPLLVVAAIATDELPSGLDDSKKLTKTKREELAVALLSVCQFGEGWVSPDEINAGGLTSAMRLGVARALNSLEVLFDSPIIIDGHINYCPDKYINVSTIIKADSLVPIVSAASIYAKVARDKYMAQQAVIYPGYGFEKHMGYGTAHHFKAISNLGVIESLHRRGFAPIKTFLETNK